ncbi:hypothetical protein [Rhabdochromatium marinum]|uniref:hypothetical protein n=1 Tax=Rhabdochromatium marinum TaxID=48729 RepID=UPI0019087DD0|nr:hypothetical protein [Rhabdochromatium marinum]MBK1649578.1 hypothetical protein [Rhabdochromatium marinum]
MGYRTARAAPGLPARVHLQAQTLEALDDGLLPGIELGLAVVEQTEVVDIAQIGLATQFTLHE